MAWARELSPPLYAQLWSSACRDSYRMTVLHSCHCALPPTTRVRLHATTCPKLPANPLRLSSVEGVQQIRTSLITLKRKRVRHRHNRCSEQSAFTCTAHQAPQASTADASTERRPKVVGLGLACWDFLAQVAAFPKPDEKLRTQKMEVFHWPKSGEPRRVVGDDLPPLCFRQGGAVTAQML